MKYDLSDNLTGDIEEKFSQNIGILFSKTKEVANLTFLLALAYSVGCKSFQINPVR